MKKIYAFFYGSGEDTPKVFGSVPRPLVIRIGIFLVIALSTVAASAEFSMWTLLSLAPFAAGVYSFALFRRVFRIQLSLLPITLAYIYGPAGVVLLAGAPVLLALYSLRHAVWLFYSYAEGMVALLAAIILGHNLGMAAIVVFPVAFAAGVALGFICTRKLVETIPDIPLLTGDKQVRLPTGKGSPFTFSMRTGITILLVSLFIVSLLCSISD